MLSLETFEQLLSGKNLAELCTVKNAVSLLTGGRSIDTIATAEWAYLKGQLAVIEKGAWNILVGGTDEDVPATIGSITNVSVAEQVKATLQSTLTNAVERGVEEPVIAKLNDLIDLAAAKVEELTGSAKDIVAGIAEQKTAETQDTTAETVGETADTAAEEETVPAQEEAATAEDQPVAEEATGTESVEEAEAPAAETVVTANEDAQVAAPVDAAVEEQPAATEVAAEDVHVTETVAESKDETPAATVTEAPAATETPVETAKVDVVETPAVEVAGPVGVTIGEVAQAPAETVAEAPKEEAQSVVIAGTTPIAQ